MHFQTSHLHPRHAPHPWHCFALKDGLASDLTVCLSVVLRTSCIARRLVSRISPYRVRMTLSTPGQSTGCLFTFSCSPPHLAVTQLLSVRGRKLRHRGTFTLQCTLPLKRTSAGFSPLRSPRVQRVQVIASINRAVKRPEGRGPFAVPEIRVHSSSFVVKFNV
jgi:hypothetical protein